MAGRKQKLNDEIRRLITRAKKGDENALQQLLTYNSKVAKRANQRLARLERAGLDKYSYDRATAYTQQEYGGNRFTTDRKRLKNIEDLEAQLLEVETFLKSQTSTVSGHAKIRAQRLRQFRDIGFDIPVEEEDAFLEFIIGETFQILKQYVPSDQILEDFATAYGSGYSLKYINEQFTKVVDGEITYDVALENIGIEI